MTYATLTDLTTRFGAAELTQLTDRLGGVQIDTAVIDQALNDASAVIDGYLAGRYALPLSPVPSILISYACDLARERLWKDAASELIVKRGDDARKFLALAAAGKVTLGIQPDPAAAPGADAVQMAPVRERTWAR